MPLQQTQNYDSWEYTGKKRCTESTTYRILFFSYAWQYIF
ncbi:hypothetical protein CIT292_06372 [Citrobacter youngae ATCC 29220]|uniref:Uncharacterized protein n=1 Tax=Citrobacter youngae ATCC 29220 TaxID=500640 RepID=D4B7W8_9ENTR|nr:hypothetical protein CIT292_06372 [Citrobacter youngae ATCC 29220]